jgi:hypothetical protein
MGHCLWGGNSPFPPSLRPSAPSLDLDLGFTADTSSYSQLAGDSLRSLDGDHRLSFCGLRQRSGPEVPTWLAGTFAIAIMASATNWPPMASALSQGPSGGSASFPCKILGKCANSRLLRPPLTQATSVPTTQKIFHMFFFNNFAL